MNIRNAAILLGFAAAALPVYAADAPLPRPVAGKVEIMRLGEIKPGMKATAWTVFQGTVPEPIPVEIVGRLRNQNGPNQDIIIGKMLGKAKVTNVAGGMSGSPVYIDGKLIGAVALRMSTFSPDAICGITPIELMLEINDLDKSRPEDAHTPDKTRTHNSPVSIGPDLAGRSGRRARHAAAFGHDDPHRIAADADRLLRQFAARIRPDVSANGSQRSRRAGRGPTTSIATSPPPDGSTRSIPGRAVAGVLVDGDMAVTGLGTVTYNDGKRVLGFGHPFFNLGPVDIPMSKGEVVMTLASAYQPNKMANATEIVGALHQDRYTGIMGVLGAESSMIPVSVKVRSLDDKSNLTSEKSFHFNVFVHQKWTPYLMMLTLYNSLSQLNEFADEATYRLNGKVEMAGAPPISLSTMAGQRRNAHTRAAAHGLLVGQHVQPPVPEQREYARREERQRHCGPAARAARGGYR
jgi:hypothetical protein